MRWINWGRSPWLVFFIFFMFSCFCWFLASTSIAFYCPFLASVRFYWQYMYSPNAATGQFGQFPKDAKGSRGKDMLWWPKVRPGGENDERLQKSGQIIIFHQPRFPWNKGISLAKPPFGVVWGRYNLTRKIQWEAFWGVVKPIMDPLIRPYFLAMDTLRFAWKWLEIEGFLIHV